MTRNYNSVELIGNIGKAPELRHTPNNTAVTDFTLAMSKSCKDADGNEKSETTWIRIVCWSFLAETVCKILNTGDLVFVHGRLSSRNYEKDGQKHSVVEVVAEDVLLMRASNKNATPAEGTMPDEAVQPK